jgi:quinol monooxygenase YgiN
MIVRVSEGHFEPDRYDEVERLLREGGERLKPAIRDLPGCLHYYAGINRAASAIINVSVWEKLAHAEQMSSLPEMAAEGALMRSLGVRFETIVNHETEWTITP